MTVAMNKHVQLGAPARSRARNGPFPVSDLLKVRRELVIAYLCRPTRHWAGSRDTLMMRGRR